MRLICLAHCFLFLATACGKAADKAPLPSPTASESGTPCGPGLAMGAEDPVVTIDGKAIPCSELYARDKALVEAIEQKYEEKLGEIHGIALAELIDDRLLQAAAEQKKLSVEDFIAASISAVPASEEDVKSFYDQAVASGEKLPAFEETKKDIAIFITERRQRVALSEFRAQLRSQSKIKAQIAVATPPPVQAAPSAVSADPSAVSADPASAEAGAKDSAAAKDPAAKDPAAKDPAAKDPAASKGPKTPPAPSP